MAKPQTNLDALVQLKNVYSHLALAQRPNADIVHVMAAERKIHAKRIKLAYSHFMRTRYALLETDAWAARATALHSTLTKAYVKNATTKSPVHAQLYAEMLDAASLQDDGDIADDSELQDTFADSAHYGGVLALLGMGAPWSVAQNGIAVNSDLTSAEIWDSGLNSTQASLNESILSASQTNISSYASLLTNATDDTATLSLDDVDSSLTDLLAAQSDTVATTSLTDIIGGVGTAMMSANGIAQKRWVTLEGACAVCIGNEATGWIGVDDTYPSGDDHPPAHPHCRCSEVSDDSGDSKNDDEWVGPDESQGE